MPRSSSERRGTLLLVGALHLALVLLWPRDSGSDQPLAARNESAVVFVKARSVPKDVASPQRQVRPRLPNPLKLPVRREPAMVFVPTPLTEAPAPAAESVAPPAIAADILAQARRDVGKIDRDLRKSSLNIFARESVLTPSAREKAFAAAYVGGGLPPIVETVTNDGRRISRRGNMCAEKEHNGLVGGRDVFRDGAKTKWMSCPK